ncbi:uncharacterized protein LOC123694383 [Colias croceus]|uniref:uncharacterized protein LOC123694383 n=1 Tax=Colias crocea TaxID=72248 RepID=UPI001E27BFEB|nr:uncharacterized protein LOC123694383 [Colias croceus]
MIWLAITLFIATRCVDAQITAQSSVAPELRECYTNPQFLDRNNLPPTTLPVLIDIIQQIEDNPNINMDLRQLAVQLLHAFRQDGIEFHQSDSSSVLSSNVLPYAPTFHSFHRHRLLLTKIIPGNSQALPNNTISSALKCALHHMLSTTVDARVRGNENSCNQLSQYRALRTARHAPPQVNADDVEILDLDALKSANTMGKMQHYNPKSDVEFTSMGGSKSERQLLGDSQCPLLTGAVFTRWGAVSAGHVIAGIAGGAQFQRVPIQELTRGSLNDYSNVQQTVSSIFTATLSGDIAEVVLIQGTERGNSISVGVAGNWNSTQAPRYYMLHNRLNVEMTDPEIRGDIDGFVLGTLINSNVDTSGTLKLSQLLDMYYSPRNGVYNSARRACNRRALSQEFIVRDTLIGESQAFVAALDTSMPLRGTIVSGLDQLVTSAVQNFQTYTTNNLNDLSCINTETTTNDYRLKTNLYIVLDSAWPYQAVYPAISFLLDGIEVGKFGSSVTLLSAFDGSVIVNKTFSLAEFHSSYTLARHQTLLNGVNLENTLSNIRISMQTELENEKTANYVGGNSSVLLFLLNTGNLNINEQIINNARQLNETVPDLRVLFATSTNQFDILWTLVRDMHNDIRTISLNNEGTNVEIAMNPILTRIETVGRRIINPNCGSTFSQEWRSGTRQFADNVEPGYINFYAISPNYFFGNNENSKVRITRTGSSVGSLVVCQSRTVPQPRQNVTMVGDDVNAVICQTLASGNVEISLRGACDGHWTVGACPPFYISVQSQVTDTTSLSATCTEPTCRFPYNVRYQVQIEDLGCFSSAGTAGLSLILGVSIILFNLVKLF